MYIHIYVNENIYTLLHDSVMHKNVPSLDFEPLAYR